MSCNNCGNCYDCLTDNELSYNYNKVMNKKRFLRVKSKKKRKKRRSKRKNKETVISRICKRETRIWFFLMKMKRKRLRRRKTV